MSSLEEVSCEIQPSGGGRRVAEGGGRADGLIFFDDVQYRVEEGRQMRGSRGSHRSC